MSDCVLNIPARESPRFRVPINVVSRDYDYFAAGAGEMRRYTTEDGSQAHRVVKDQVAEVNPIYAENIERLYLHCRDNERLLIVRPGDTAGSVRA